MESRLISFSLSVASSCKVMTGPQSPPLHVPTAHFADENGGPEWGSGLCRVTIREWPPTEGLLLAPRPSMELALGDCNKALGLRGPQFPHM